MAAAGARRAAQIIAASTTTSNFLLAPRPRRALVTAATAAAAAAALQPAAPAMAPPPPPRSPALPREPLRYLSPRGGTAGGPPLPHPPLLDLSDLEGAIEAADERRQAAYELSRKVGAALARCRAASERWEGEEEAEAELADLMGTVLGTREDTDGTDTDADGGGGDGLRRSGSKPREGNLSYKVEDYVRHVAYGHFLRTGTLLPPSSVPAATDEEYLAGACIGLSHDLARYGIGRATERDVRSVRLARDLVSDVMDVLLLFDFRNGPLRRKYDGTKYALRTLETVLYELSVTGAEEGGDGDDDGDGGDAEAKEGGEPETKRTKLEGGNDCSGGNDGNGEDQCPPAPGLGGGLVPTSELESLRLRMERRDELREDLIKRCRDGQKAAKQSIFALHRGDAARALGLIGKCERCVRDDLLPIVTDEPSLRSGSFSNVLEEYAEARLFYAWLHGTGDGDGGEDGDGKRNGGKGGPPSDPASRRPAGTLLRLSDFALPLEPEEYLGGLCDLTGEIGRHAVQRGTDRDAAGVRLCLETNLSVLLALQALSRFPSGGGVGKKMDPLRRSVEKLERIMYELSLVEATGGTRNVVVDSVSEDVGGGQVEG